MKTSSTFPAAPQHCNDPRRALLDDYALGKLSPEKMEALEAHYFSCDECLRDLQLRERLVRYLRDQNGEISLAAHVYLLPRPGRIRTRLYGAAAAALLILTLLRAFLVPLPSPRDHELRSDYQQQYGPAFAANPAFEARMKQSLRSAGTVAVQSPANGAILSPPFHFRWSRDSAGNAPEVFTLTIFNNRLELIRTYITPGDVISCPIEIPPGRYYWTLETPYATLHRGSFLVLPSGRVPYLPRPEALPPEARL